MQLISSLLKLLMHFPFGMNANLKVPFQAVKPLSRCLHR